MDPDIDIILIFVTAPNQEEAERIGTALVENKLVACVNILPKMTSIYRWESKIQTDSELLMLIKTQRKLFNKVKEAIVSLHSYQLPEIIAINLSDGLPEYLNWVINETTE